MDLATQLQPISQCCRYETSHWGLSSHWRRLKSWQSGEQCSTTWCVQQPPGPRSSHMLYGISICSEAGEHTRAAVAAVVFSKRWGKKKPRSVLCFPAGWCPFLYPRDCLLYYIDWFCLLYYIPFLLHPFFLVRSSEIILCASLAFKLYMLIHVLTGTQARSKLNRLQWGITTNLLVYLAASWHYIYMYFRVNKVICWLCASRYNTIMAGAQTQSLKGCERSGSDGGY